MAVIDSLIYVFLVLKNHKLPFYALYYVSEAVEFFFFEALGQLRSGNTLAQREGGIGLYAYFVPDA